jgi:CRP-like cAMP-binding protein
MGLLKKINLLENANSSELVFFLTKMKPCLFLADEYVVKEGTRADDLYFISKGTL